MPQQRLKGLVMQPENAIVPARAPITFALYPDVVAQATGTGDEVLGCHLVTQAASALSAEGDGEREFQATVAAMRGLAPRDALEGMMATQMAAVHNAAMDCLRRAQSKGQDGQVRDRSFRQATRLAALFARQSETLDRRRGRGPQTLNVGQVTVEAGGQAVVGSVNTTGPARLKRPRFAPADAG